MQRSDTVEAKGCILDGQNNDDMETKKCSKCGEEKALSEFGRHRYCKNGINPQCKKCNRINALKYAKENKHKVILSKKEYYKSNKQKIRENQVLYEQKNRKQILEYKRKWYKENKDRVLKENKEFYSNNKEEINKKRRHKYKKAILKAKGCKGCKVVFTPNISNKQIYCASCRKERLNARVLKRKALKRSSINKGLLFTAKDIFKRDKWTCKICGVKVQKKHIHKSNAAEMDHIIPVTKGGLHIPSNIQTLCRRCNARKGNKIIGQLTLIQKEQCM